MLNVSSVTTWGRRLAARCIITLMVMSSPAWAQDGLSEGPLDVCPTPVRSTDASAENVDRGVVQPMVMKLARGLGNLTLSWAELPKQVMCVWRERGWLIGLTRGTMDGLGMSVARMMAGAYEIVTFPIPIPPSYAPMVMPEYVWNPEPSSEQ
jgi:putative exosortase-associated protein (TIGR04073 family)